jgi:hypothetical protein
VEYVDMLGRTFLSVSHNRVARDGVVEEARLHTRVELDVLGNRRALIDAMDRVIARCEVEELNCQNPTSFLSVS